MILSVSGTDEGLEYFSQGDIKCSYQQESDELLYIQIWNWQGERKR